MSEATHHIQGRAAAIRIENLDTDQIMPKQFLRGIDKSGLAQGLLYDLRYDPTGTPRPDFVLNQQGHQGVNILLGGSNFGCGSSREHAVWGLQQFGIRAVIAPSFGEIFYSNAMNNQLMLVMLAPQQVQALMDEVEREGTPVVIDVGQRRVRSKNLDLGFSISDRHRQMFLERLDVIGLTLQQREGIAAFAERHWRQQPWCKDVASQTHRRLQT
ncbi:MAG TPA: 3-isopropylmalate dehydratase small subunit [Hydrogenophaga sp.]|uniref:3-isopropylmalate dehydratase small subunit n=1 Tax=Hydrogenophaga sp. TaxID=1904254 RepID=UPI002C1A0F63|nr:3-isopropylmalate dehydratase small subunit [Hydrogenophaga sp.]HSX94292.1 3-isopropylmalate dehydratase small subunit [Hydrogenophaga sp.]